MKKYSLKAKEGKYNFVYNLCTNLSMVCNIEEEPGKDSLVITVEEGYTKETTNNFYRLLVDLLDFGFISECDYRSTLFVLFDKDKQKTARIIANSLSRMRNVKILSMEKNNVEFICYGLEAEKQLKKAIREIANETGIFLYK